MNDRIPSPQEGDVLEDTNLRSELRKQIQPALLGILLLTLPTGIAFPLTLAGLAFQLIRARRHDCASLLLLFQVLRHILPACRGYRRLEIQQPDYPFHTFHPVFLHTPGSGKGFDLDLIGPGNIFAFKGLQKDGFMVYLADEDSPDMLFFATAADYVQNVGTHHLTALAALIARQSYETQSP